MESIIARGREAQARWSGVPLPTRLSVIRNARHAIAARAEELASTLAPELNRNIADTLVAEVLPLAEACRFLERESPRLLRTTRLGRAGRPLWLHGVDSEIQRVPLGLALIIAPSNYPLFLPGVQALQAIAAGNAVLLKPAAGGQDAARALARLLTAAGLPEHVLQVLDAAHQTGIDAIRTGVDKVFLTGHADTGRAVMHELAAKLTPSVMELSGCDSVFVLPGADLERTAQALAFGMRLNGSATCMAPRRVFASASIIEKLVACLMPKLERLQPVALTPKVTSLLDSLLRDAEQRGAIIARDGRSSYGVTPTIVLHAHPDQIIMQTDIFAPVLSFCAVPDLSTALRFNAQCPYALTAAIFGPEAEASRLAGQLRAGTVLINDLIVSTADPRVPFGGRGQSGFGVTRGREGLLEMTTTKTILRQKSRSLRPYAPTGGQHREFFNSFIQTLHAGSLAAKYQGLRRFIASARKVDNH
jgi:aldehyde dehydrogenase (NAD+)